MATVRAATAADLDAMRALFREYQAWVAEPCCFAGFERELAELPGEYETLLLAEEAGAPAGCVGVRRLPGGDLEMKRLYVRPTHQGHGLGRRLALGAIEAARDSGCRVLYLDTLPKMTAAIALYAALGFSRRGPYASPPTPGALFYELTL